jgi:hypothetical protein
MTAILADQLVIARQAIEEERRKRDEEYQKDLEALKRIARFLPAISAPSDVNGAQVEVKVPSVLKQSADHETPCLISKVQDAVLSRPNIPLSPRAVLQIMEAQNFPFTRDNGKRIFSVAQSLRKLTERNLPQIRLVRRGSGRRPNLYQAAPSETNPAHVRTAARLSERTM